MLPFCHDNRLVWGDCMLPDGQKQEVLQREVTLILESEAFARSKANRALLEYLAKECLAGRGDEITEYGIAHGLLGRGDEFDPSTDPIVRVRMRRLREAINGYYAQHDDRVDRLNIPRGSYALSVLRVEQPLPPLRNRRKMRRLTRSRRLMRRAQTVLHNRLPIRIPPIGRRCARCLACALSCS